MSKRFRDNRSVMVKGYAQNTPVQAIEEVFSMFGRIESVKELSRRSCIVQFLDNDAAEKS